MRAAEASLMRSTTTIRAAAASLLTILLSGVDVTVVAAPVGAEGVGAGVESVVVKYREGTTASQRRALESSVGVSVDETKSVNGVRRTATLKVGAADAADAVERLRASGRV